MDVNVNLSMFYVLICFLIIFFVAKRTLFARLEEILGERREMIQGAQEAAQDSEESVSTSLSEINAKLAEARTRAFGTRHVLRDEALSEQKGIIEDARLKAGQKIEQTELELHDSLEEAKKQIDIATESLAKEISKAILGNFA